MNDFDVVETGSERGLEAGITYSLGAVSRLTGLSPHVLAVSLFKYKHISNPNAL